MLRETRAKWLAVATAGLVVGLAAAFAALRNAEQPPVAPRAAAADGAPAAAPTAASATPSAATSPPAPARDAGASGPAKVPPEFDRLGCAACHSLAGHGHARRPLDGIGGRLDRAAIRDWAIGTGEAADQLAPGVVRRKARAAQDPGLEALVEALARLR